VTARSRLSATAGLPLLWHSVSTRGLRELTLTLRRATCTVESLNHRALIELFVGEGSQFRACGPVMRAKQVGQIVSVTGGGDSRCSGRHSSPLFTV
jgi:hypothetical protein